MISKIALQTSQFSVKQTITIQNNVYWGGNITMITVEHEKLYDALPASWKQPVYEHLKTERQYTNNIDRLVNFVKNERRLYSIYPKVKNTFKALELTPFDQVRVVILGQDPYHTPGIANGLAFSTADMAYTPPSLQNIYKELQTDIGSNHHIWGEYHSQQGVLLLNTALTVRESEPNSHAEYWQFLTSAILRATLYDTRPKVFLLWGKQAESTVNKLVNTSLNNGINGQLDLITALNSNRHTFLKAAHPSPLSAHRGFFGCKHFSKCNIALELFDQPTIDW